MGFLKVTSKPKVSLHALIGSSNSWTMRIEGKVAQQWIVILIDSYITYNFLGPAEAKKSRFPICLEEKVKSMSGKWQPTN